MYFKEYIQGAEAGDTKLKISLGYRDPSGNARASLIMVTMSCLLLDINFWGPWKDLCRTLGTMLAHYVIEHQFPFE